MKQLSIQLAVSLDEIERLSAAVADFCDRNRIAEHLKYTLQLVCDEWVTNIIRHGYGGAGPAGAAAKEPPIVVSLDLAAGGLLRIEFTDGAPAFNPLEHPEPDLSLPVEERPIGGLGIHFIKTKMDRCIYSREGNRNRLLLEKKMDQTKGAES